MTAQQVVNAAIVTMEEMRGEFVPIDTGNMARDALGYIIDGNIMDITVDKDIAPYVPYTNEPWISPKWHGKKNPNEGWWERFADEFAKRLATRLKGDLK